MSTEPYANMLTWFAVTLACLGYIDRARSMLNEAFSEARRLGQVSKIAHVLVLMNLLDWLTRSPMVHVQETLALTIEHGFPFFSGLALAFRGRSLIALGQAPEGLALVTQGLAELHACGAVNNTPMLHVAGGGPRCA